MSATSLEQNKALMQRWFEEVWNQGRTEVIDELRATQAVASGWGDLQKHQGPEPFRAFHANLRSALPDIHVEIRDIVAEGDRVAVRIHIEGTHCGQGLGVQPSGNRVKIGGMVVARIQNGRIVEAWNTLDLLTLLTDIGAVEDPIGPKRFLAAID